MVLAPGASHRMTVTITAHQGAAAVARLQGRINFIQKQVRPGLLSQPKFEVRPKRLRRVR